MKLSHSLWTETTSQYPKPPLLLLFFALVDELPLAASSLRQGWLGHYSEQLFLKALVPMVVRWLPTVHALVPVLDQPVMEVVRTALPPSLPEQIAVLDEHVMAPLDPKAKDVRVAAIDSTVLPARGVSGTRSIARPM